jgi:transposase
VRITGPAQSQAREHAVKLIAPRFVKPYVKSNKNDVADAEAICEAVGRPTMRFRAATSRQKNAPKARPLVQQ